MRVFLLSIITIIACPLHSKANGVSAEFALRIKDLTWIRLSDSREKVVHNFEIIVMIEDRCFRVTRYENFGEKDLNDNSVMWACLCDLDEYSGNGEIRATRVDLDFDWKTIKDLKVAVVHSGVNINGLVAHPNERFKILKLVNVPIAIYSQ